MLWRIANLIVRIVNPCFWIQVKPVDWEWDRYLYGMIKSGMPVTQREKYTVRIDGIKVWSSNYPYGYGNHYDYDSGIPSPITRILLKKYIAANTSWKNEQGRV